MRDRGDRVPLIGRVQELDALREQLQAARRGQGGLVLMVGEAGAGKTRLLSELAEGAAAEDWLVLRGRAYEAAGTPYLPFAEALGEYVRGCPVDALRVQLGVNASEVALLLPELRRRLTDLPLSAPQPEQARYRLFQGITDFIAAIARAGSRGVLLLHLGRRLASMPVLVAVACRPPEASGPHPLTDLFATLRREPLGERLALAPLSPEAAADLVEALSGQTPATAVAAALYQQTNGNPFFLQELVRHLHAGGRALGDPALAGETWRVPVGVREVLRARLARLSPEANRLLQAAAVLGEGVRFDVLGDAAGIEPLALLDAVEEATATGVLREEQEGYHFSHALIRQAVHDDLSLPRRQYLHGRAAAAIERLYVRDLTSHLPALAGPAAAEQALIYARRAGEAAMTVYAWEAAIQHWQAALALLGPAEVEHRCDLLLLLGETQNRAGDRGAARDSCYQASELARRLGSGEHLARAALGYAGVWVAFGRSDADVIALLEEALAVLGEGDGALRCRLLARLAMELSFTAAAARRDALSLEAVEAARRLGEPTALLQALNARHYAVDAPEQLAERLALADELVAVATAAGDKEALAIGHGWRLGNLLETGELAAADRELTAFTSLAGELQQPVPVWRAAMWRAMRALLEGRFADAERLIAEAQQLGKRTQNPDARLVSAMQRQILRRQRGELEEGDLARALAERRHSPPVPAQDVWLVRLLLDLGRREEVQAGLDRLLEHDFAALPAGPARLTALALLAEVSAALADRRHAATLYQLLEPYATRLVMSSGAAACHGAAAHYLGLLAATLERWQEAEQHFQAAGALHQRLGARAFLAQTWFEHGRMLLVRGLPGDGERAVELVAQAGGLAETLGMAPLALEAARLSASYDHSHGDSGDDASIPARPLPDGLTPREAEVLRLIAGGLTTREVAAELVVTADTVHRHIANLYAKIGARGRADATAYAFTHGLIPPRPA